MRELMTLTAYAARCGVDKSVISRQVKAGQIPVVYVDGRVWPMIDPIVADAARAQNIDAAKAHRHEDQSHAPPHAAIAGDAAPPVTGAARVPPTLQQADPSPAPILDERRSARQTDGGIDYTKARTLAVGLNARKLQLDLAEREKSVVPAADVESAREEAAAIARDRLFALFDDHAEIALQKKTSHEMRIFLRGLLTQGLNTVCDTLNGMADDIDAVAASNEENSHADA